MWAFMGIGPQELIIVAIILMILLAPIAILVVLLLVLGAQGRRNK